MPILATALRNEASVPKAKARSLNSPMSTTGCAARRSRSTNSGSPTTKAASPPSTTGCCQPSRVNSDSASSSPPRVSRTSALPGASSPLSRRPGAGRRSTNAPHTRQITPIGTLNQNTQRQPRLSASTPPSVGPISPAMENEAT